MRVNIDFSLLLDLQFLFEMNRQMEPLKLLQYYQIKSKNLQKVVSRTIHNHQTLEN